MVRGHRHPSRARYALGIGALALALGAVPWAAAAQPVAGGDGRVYLTAEESFHEIFGGGVSVETDRARLAPADVRGIAEGSGSRAVDPDPTTYRIFARNGSLLGYAMILEERGKYRPITFMVGADPGFEIIGVEVMVYREDRGDEVRHGRFLRQYRGKSLTDPIRTHRDIVNITGATISVGSLNTGVRRALETLGRIYGPGGGLARAAR